MKKVWIVLVCITVGGLGAVAPARHASAAGTTRYVAPGGSDTTNNCLVKVAPCATVGHALAQAVASDTVQLEPGTYLVSANAPGEANVIGAGVTIQSDPVGGTAANTIIDATNEFYGIVVTASDATIANITVRNADREGVLVTSLVNTTITGFTISGASVVDNDQCWQHPLAATCDPSRPANDFGAGILLRGVSASHVAGNTVSGNFDGIRVTDGPAGRSDEITISDNDIPANRSNAIEIAGTSNKLSRGVFSISVLRNNATGSLAGSGILLTEIVRGAQVSNIVIHGNHVVGNHLAGITIATPTDAFDTIQANTFGTNGPRDDLGDAKRTGIAVAAPSLLFRSTIDSNTFSDLDYGVWLTSSSNFRVQSNTWTRVERKVFVKAAGAPSVTALAPLATGDGYWMADTIGEVFPFGETEYYGSAFGHVATAPIVGAATTPSGLGYWLVESNGAIFGLGNAQYLGAANGLRLSRPIVGMTATLSGHGYWFVASDGGIFSYGDAAFHGSTGAMRLNRPVVGMAATPSGHGYWLVASDGGIFSFGDAHFYGSTGRIHLNQPVVGMAATPSGKGYWLVAADGGIFAFGDAHFYGSTGAIHLNQPVVGMAATPSGHGYWLVARDGGIFSYGDAAYLGSTAG